MQWKKSIFTLPFVISILAFGMYGCGSMPGVSHTDEKPPYFHGHVEAEPPESHMRAEHGAQPKKVEAPPKVESDMLTTDGAWPTNDKDCCSVIHMEKTGPRTGKVGVPYCYTIKVTNLTKRNVKNVEVVQSLPKNFQVKSSEPKMEGGGDTGKWFLGDFGPQEVKVIKVCGLPTQSGSMPFCTDVTYKLPEICIDPMILEPKLTIAKRASPEVLLCDVIQVTFTVKNTGTGVAENVKIKDSLPPGLKTVDGKSNVVLDVGTLKAGESKDVTLTVKAEKTGTFTNSATVVAEGLSGESNQTTTVVKQPVLSIAKSGPAKVYVGRKITYDIVITNKGDGAAASTIIEDAIPSNTSVASASQGGAVAGSTVTWNVGTLQPNDSRKVSVTLNPAGIGIVNNVVTAKAGCAAAVSAAASTEVSGISAILLEVIDIEDPIEVGGNETYEITVTNQGSDTGTNVKVTCMLEDQMQFVSTSGPTKGTCADGKTVTFDPLPTLASKAKATWKVIVKAVGEGDVRFRVNMIEDCLKRNVEETEATNFYKNY